MAHLPHPSLHPMALFSEKCVHTLTSASIPSPCVELHVHFCRVPPLVSAPLPGTPTHHGRTLDTALSHWPPCLPNCKLLRGGVGRLAPLSCVPGPQCKQHKECAEKFCRRGRGHSLDKHLLSTGCVHSLVLSPVRGFIMQGPVALKRALDHTVFKGEVLCLPRATGGFGRGLCLEHS